MRMTEQAVMSWGAALTWLAATVSTLASEQALPPGSQAASQEPADSTIGAATAAEAGSTAWAGEDEYLTFVWSDARDLKRLPAAEGQILAREPSRMPRARLPRMVQ